MQAPLLQFCLILALSIVAGLSSGCSKAARTARHMERADRYFAAGDYGKAKIDYLNVLRAQAVNSKAIERLGHIWYEQGAYIKAASFLLRANELDPGNSENRGRLTKVLAALGQKAEARKQAAAWLARAPQNGEALLLLTESSISESEVAEAQQALDDFAHKESPLYSLALSQMALRRKDLAAAEKFANDAAAADAALPNAHAALGFLALLKKDSARARNELEAAAETAPLRSNFRVLYGDYLAQTGAPDEAIAYLTALTKRVQDYFPYWTTLGRLALAGKRYDEALTDLERVLAQDPDNPDALMVQAQTFLAKGDTNKSIDQLERLHQTYAGVPAVKFQLGRAYLQDGRVPQARTLLEEAVAANSGYTEAILLLAELDIRSGKPQNAIPPLEKLIKTPPTPVQAARLLADAYHNTGRLEDAAALFRQQIQLVPNWAEPHYFIGILLREQGKNAEARASFARASEIEPQNPGPIEKLVEMDIADKEFGAALRRVEEQLLAKDANSAPAHFLLAKILLAQDRTEEAVAELQKATELDPKLDVAYRLLVATYIAKGKLPEAAAQLEQELAKNPKNATVLFTLGMVSSALKDFPKARDLYENLLVVQPDAALAMNNLAVLYAEQFNDLETAYKFANKARLLAPGDAHIADTLGWILYKRQDFDQAATLLREAASILGESAEVQFHYGMAAYMMGATEEARRALQKAADSSADFTGKPEAQARLSMLAAGGKGPERLSVAQLRDRLKEHPDDIMVLVQLADLLSEQGTVSEAASTYEKAFQINPKAALPVLKLAQLYAGPLKDPGKALDFAKRARDLAPRSPEAAGLLGSLVFEAGNFQWAYSLLQEALRQKPDDVALLHRMAWASYSLGRIAEAEPLMQRVADSGSTDQKTVEDARRFLALLALTQTGQIPAAAENDLRRTLSQEPDYVPALMVQAALQSRENDRDAAVATYSRILTRYPEFAPAQKELAALYADEPAQREKAYQMASTARQTLPDDPELTATLAKLNYLRKDYRRAIQLLDELQKRQSLSGESLYTLGMSQFQTGDRAAATESLQKALAAGLQTAASAEARRILAGGEPQ